MQFDFSKGPQKVLIERFDSNSAGNITLLHLKSGETSYVFAMDVSLAKKLSKGLGQQVEQFEKVNKIIVDDRLDNEPLPSPLQLKPDAPKA